MKKIPLRKCVATQVQCPKQEMIRVVKTKENEVFVESYWKEKRTWSIFTKNKRSH